MNRLVRRCYVSLAGIIAALGTPYFATLCVDIEPFSLEDAVSIPTLMMRFSYSFVILSYPKSPFLETTFANIT